MSNYTLTVLGGGPDAKEAIPLSMTVRLRKALKELEANSYSTEVDSFDIKLMIEGSLSKFEETGGCHRVRFFKRTSEVSAEIIVKKQDWTGKTGVEIMEMLGNNVLLAFEGMIARIKKENVIVKEGDLIADLKSHLKAWKSK